MKKHVILIFMMLIILVSCKQSNGISFNYDPYIIFEEDFQTESRSQFNLNDVKDIEDGEVFYLVLVKEKDGLVEEVVEEMRFFYNMDLDGRRERIKMYYDAEKEFESSQHIRVNIEEVQSSVIVRTTYFMNEIGAIINLENPDDMNPLLYRVQESYSEGQVVYSEFVENLKIDNFVEVELND